MRRRLRPIATRSRLRLRASGPLATVIALGMAASAYAAPASWTDFTALADTRLEITSNIEANGHFAVIQPGGLLRVGLNSYHNGPPADAYLAADVIELENGASANDVFVNSLKLDGTSEVRGATTSPFAFPLNVTPPVLPAAVDDPCTGSASNVIVTVAKSPQAIAPGCYKDLVIRNGAVGELAGGSYTFRKVLVEGAASGEGGQLIASSTAVLSVQETFVTEINADVFPASTNPADLTIYVKGANNQVGNGSLNNPNALFLGRIAAPNDGNLQIGVRAVYVGSAYAAELVIFGVHLPRKPTPTPTLTPTPTPTPTATTPFIPPTPTPTSPPTPTPTPTPEVTPTPTPTTPFVPPTPTPTPTPTATPEPTPTETPDTPPTPTQPFVPPERCPMFTSPQPC